MTDERFSRYSLVGAPDGLTLSQVYCRASLLTSSTCLEASCWTIREIRLGNGADPQHAFGCIDMAMDDCTLSPAAGSRPVSLSLDTSIPTLWPKPQHPYLRPHHTSTLFIGSHEAYLYF